VGVKTSAFHAAGTSIGFNVTSAGSTYTSVGQLADLSFGGLTVPEIDTTLLSSVVRTSIPGLPDSGDVTFNIFYVPSDTGVIELVSLAQSPKTIFWSVMLPDGTSSTTGTALQFAAYLTSFAPSGFAPDDKPVADVTLRITGAVTVVPAT
jgi:Lambda phage tail tube protein, TTP